LKDVRVVKTVNFGYPSGSVGWIRSLVGRVRRKISPSPVSAYITQSTGQGKFLNRYYGVHPDLIHVIPHAVDVDGFKRVVSHVRTGESTVTKVLTVSALRKEKGILRLLKVASRVKWHYARHDISFVIVGGGFMLKEFIDFSQKLDVTDVLVFAGHSDNVIDFYNSADIFFSPSDIESFSLASAEAMAMELPLVATRTHGLEDLVSPAITGFLHDLDDIDGMAISIIRYADDPALRAAHGRSGRQKIISYAGFSEEAIAISKVIRGNQ
jgi:glycosyltransferase involved in cell wall biosynthesis